MNFFGHALVAHRLAQPDDAVLGAMLPDFAGMMGLRILATHGELQAGVELHHETDRRFHGHPAFVELCANGIDALVAQGVARGPARASAHVGLELLLDGVLGSDEAGRGRYRTALERARDPALEALVQFREADGADQLRMVAGRLLGAPLPQAYGDPALVADRLAHLLSYRPRLALDSQSARRVSVWLAEVQPRLEAVADELLNDMLRVDADKR